MGAALGGALGAEIQHSRGGGGYPGKREHTSTIEKWAAKWGNEARPGKSAAEEGRKENTLLGEAKKRRQEF
jgi:hypothetical protein